jgi:hypothetical protein
MKRANVLLLAALMFAASCENTWDGETKDMFHQSCMEDALTWAPNQDKAREYCDCVLQRTMEKYPKMSDALQNIDSVITDTRIKSCKQDIIK